jgi:hypothetical protein
VEASGAYHGCMIVQIVFFAIIVLAFAFIAGTVLYGIALAVVGWVGSLLDSARASLSRSRPSTTRLGVGTAPDRAIRGSDATPGQTPIFSADEMWAQMQGRSAPRRARRKGGLT